MTPGRRRAYHGIQILVPVGGEPMPLGVPDHAEAGCSPAESAQFIVDGSMATDGAFFQLQLTDRI